MTFTPEVYEQIREGAKRSAAVIVPHVMEIVKPETVVDVGCGEGWFAREFAIAGAYVLAVDSEGPHTPPVDNPDRYAAIVTYPGATGQVDFYRRDLPCDLSHISESSYDLAVCLEVAEHLPEAAADALIESLASLAPVVLFSAAIPGQGGHGHLNEQWPDYWAARFYERGLVVSEGLRDEFWDYDEIEPWYRQNLLLAARYEWFDEHSLPFTKYPRAMVHPVIWEHRRQRP